ncbi:GlsB/YeaQ/YmgE family stress response membrane protein [Dyella sp. 20L07]|uniref:GlsB/YeaQ/YmgE family stress response membrane protein n=1 Tax=Dyella sp. 20L07 TaxID=3384240 RepID=UPI003D28ADB8
MAEHGLLAWLLIGAIAGWLAGLMVKGSGYGLLIDILIGILGAFLGGWVAHLIGLSVSGGFVVTLLVATAGAVLLLVLLRVLKQLMR